MILLGLYYKRSPYPILRPGLPAATLVGHLITMEYDSYDAILHYIFRSVRWARIHFERLSPNSHSNAFPRLKVMRGSSLQRRMFLQVFAYD